MINLVEFFIIIILLGYIYKEFSKEFIKFSNSYKVYNIIFYFYIIL